MSSADLYAELVWRDMLYDATEGAREALAAGPVTGYVGFDPTASSLHVGLAAADHGAGAPAARRTCPHRGRGRRHGPHWRSQRQDAGALAADGRSGGGERRRHPGAAGPISRLRSGRQRRPHREQRRLARPAGPDVVPARRRQALHRQLPGREGIGPPPARERGGPLLHRVQLPAAPGVRLRHAVRSVRMHAPDGRQRPVGQHHGGHRSDAEAPRRERRTGWCCRS